jgi:D-inositol-3-phosphate glycosyltransferase
MSVRRVAMLSVHTSPLAQPGAGDGGGMNVYISSLASALAHAGVECDVLTRAEHPGQPAIVDVEPGVRVVHLDAGPRAPIGKDALFGLVDELVEAAKDHLTTAPVPFDVLHSHYWISGAVGHQLKHALDLPLVGTFHTLAHTKAAAGITDDPPVRARVEAETIACLDRMIASTPDERSELIAAYGAEPDRVEVIAPGVDHAMFSPGDAGVARQRLGLPVDRPVLLFVGRIQPLKGVDVAIRALASMRDSRALLVVVGGPSGADGAAEVDRLHALARDLGVEGRVRWEPPQPHGALVDWYRAADVCLMPSRTESFGLVALEAAACGTPVVAANVGGLRSLVDDGHTGFLVDGRTGHDFAAPIERLLAEPGLAGEMRVSAAARSGRYTWNITAARLRRVYADLGARELVSCT